MGRRFHNFHYITVARLRRTDFTGTKFSDYVTLCSLFRLLLGEPAVIYRNMLCIISYDKKAGPIL
ncbi:MAG: hypothetical protein K0S39_134 [Paenibacillus sp.]|nr:hypothetical protein [Paenibacillus sp.]